MKDKGRNYLLPMVSSKRKK